MRSPRCALQDYTSAHLHTYSLICSYKNYNFVTKNLVKFNYFIDGAESIGNERYTNEALPDRDPLIEREVLSAGSKINPLPKSLDSSKIDYLERSCISLLKLPNRKNYLKRSQNVSLGIKNMVYYKAETYVVIQMENTSGIDFEVDFLKIYKILF